MMRSPPDKQMHDALSRALNLMTIAMPVRRSLSLGAVLLCLIAAPATATQPCPVPGGCIDTASASLVGAVDLIAVKCPKLDPARGDAYRDAVLALLRQDKEGFLPRLRASSVYAEVLKDLESKFEAKSEQSKSKACSEFLNR